MNSVKIDFSNCIGKIKPMHAINNMPTVPYDTVGLYKEYTRARIPYARLHDTGGAFGGAHYVDVENIFPNFDADENDPASYDFAFTDALLADMVRAGVKPFYRLGCTIENYNHIRAYHVYPPKDFHKWARICEHIILHYNHGWANGFNYGIEYWEIWNEPDNEPSVQRNPMWKGTPEQYFEMYDITAKHLKSRFPEIKIGGYAACGFYNLTDTDYSGIEQGTARGDVPEGQEISRIEYFSNFFHDFFKYISAHGSPLDFFSWHSYNVVQDIPICAEHIAENLKHYGYANAQSILDEWNPDISVRGTLRDAANILQVMCMLQNTSVDMCMYYDGNMHSSYGGLFDPVHHSCFKAYYAMLSFGELYALGNQVQAECDAQDVYVLAAVGDDGKKAVLLLNASDEACALKLDDGAPANGHLISEENHWEEINLPSREVILAPYNILLLG